MRQASIKRETLETDVKVSINLDGTGKYEIHTGSGFFDHMLEQLSRHSLIDINIEAKGDLHVDAHHLVEDVGIALGQAILKAVGEKKGIRRYGAAYVPMDEALSRVVIDLSGRSALVWQVKFPTEKVGDLDSEVFREFFDAISQNLRAAIHVINIYGENSHHIIESCYKAFGRALRHAVELDPRAVNTLPTTKGQL